MFLLLISFNTYAGFVSENDEVVCEKSLHVNDFGREKCRDYSSGYSKTVLEFTNVMGYTPQKIRVYIDDNGRQYLIIKVKVNK